MATYAVMIDPDFQQFVTVVKATADPSVDANWSNVGTNIQLGSIEDLNFIKSLWVVEDGSDLHVATQTSDGRVAYHVFDPGTDAWTTSDEFVSAAGGVPANLACSIALRSDGDVIVGYAADDGAEDEIWYSRKEGTWTRDTFLGNGGAGDNYNGVVIVRGASDRMHFFYKSDTDGDLLHRSLSSANSLDTVNQSVDTSVATFNFLCGPGVSYVSGATKVRVPYKDSDNGTSVAELDSGADPTITTDTNVGENVVVTVDGYSLHCLAIDGTTIHLVYASGLNNVHHDSNADDAGWGTDEDIITNNTATIGISCNVYTRGAKVLAFLFDDNGTIKYCEYPLAGGSIDKLSLVEFPDQNYYVGPFEI